MTSDYKVYKTRWLFLLTLALQNTICFLIGVSFSPVATLVTQYYQIDGDRIDLLVLSACGIHVIGILVSIYFIGRKYLDHLIENGIDISAGKGYPVRLGQYRSIFIRTWFLYLLMCHTQINHKIMINFEKFQNSEEVL